LKLLLDENISYKVAEQLRQAGYDALSVYEIELTKTDDEIIFDYAQKLDMVLVTQDIDFSDLNYLAQFAGSGLIILASIFASTGAGWVETDGGFLAVAISGGVRWELFWEIFDAKLAVCSLKLRLRCQIAR